MHQRISNALRLCWGAFKKTVYWLTAGGRGWRERLRKGPQRILTMVAITGLTCLAIEPYVRLWHILGGVAAGFLILFCLPIRKTYEEGDWEDFEGTYVVRKTANGPEVWFDNPYNPAHTVIVPLWRTVVSDPGEED